jgi:hypothetical protein
MKYYLHQYPIVVQVNFECGIIYFNGSDELTISFFKAFIGSDGWCLLRLLFGTMISGMSRSTGALLARG